MKNPELIMMIFKTIQTIIALVSIFIFADTKNTTYGVWAILFTLLAVS